MNGHARSCTQGGCVGCRVDRIERYLIAAATLAGERALTEAEFKEARGTIASIGAEIAAEHKAEREG